MGLNYDPLGRLNAIMAGGTTTRLLYDGDVLVGEYAASGVITRRYMHGPGIDEPLVALTDPTLTTKAQLNLFADHQGSIVAMGGTSATVINRYDAFGIGGAANGGRFQYTGQIFLPELGLYHYKARAYAPGIGRFLQTDPVGYDDGVNWYDYVHGDPVDGRDPSGLGELSLGVEAEATVVLGGKIGIEVTFDTKTLSNGGSISIGPTVGANVGVGGSASSQASSTTSVSRTRVDANVSGQALFLGVSKRIATTEGSGTRLRAVGDATRLSAAKSGESVRGKLGIGASASLQFTAQGKTSIIKDTVQAASQAASQTLFKAFPQLDPANYEKR